MPSQVIDARAKEFNIRYSKPTGLYSAFYRLQNDPPYMPPVDLAGVVAIGSFFDKCGGVKLGDFGSDTGELVHIVSDFTVSSEDNETGVVTLYDVVGGQGFRFDLSPAELAAYTWSNAYYEIVLQYPTNIYEPLARGLLIADCC